MAIKAGDAVWVFSGDVSQLKSADKQADAIMSGAQRRSTTMLNRIKARAGMVIGGAAIAGLTKSISAAAEFEHAINKVAVLTGETGEAIERTREKLSGLADEMSRRSVFSATEAADAMYFLASKGFDVARMSAEELLPILNLATGTQSELETTTKAVTGTLRAFKLENSELGRVSDAFAKSISSSDANMEKLGLSMSVAGGVAETFGVRLEETVAFLSKMYDKGVSAERAGTALANIMVRLNKETKQAEKIYVDHGIALDDISLKTHTLTEVMMNLREAKLSTTEVMELFGEEAGREVIALLGIGKSADESLEDIALFTEGIDTASGLSQKMADESMTDLSNQWKIFKNRLGEVAKGIGNQFMPYAKGLLAFLIKCEDALINGAKAWDAWWEGAAGGAPLNEEGYQERMVWLTKAIEQLMLLLGGGSGTVQALPHGAPQLRTPVPYIRETAARSTSIGAVTININGAGSPAATARAVREALERTGTGHDAFAGILE